jgi:hypothetical protein
MGVIFKDYEQKILKKQDPESLYEYSKMVIQKRWPDVEKFIIKDPIFAYKYAKNVIKGRWEMGEPYIFSDKSSGDSYRKKVYSGGQ